MTEYHEWLETKAGRRMQAKAEARIQEARRAFVDSRRAKGLPDLPGTGQEAKPTQNPRPVSRSSGPGFPPTPDGHQSR